jgi:2-polyprenyl-3-methyl-5-hydroxy-6-metoxy-1,4-benzoquinol methylase
VVDRIVSAPAPTPPSNRYFTAVDADLPNNSHAFQLRLVGRDKDVLELGCAAGHMTQALAAQGCSVVAVDVDADAADFAATFAKRALVDDLSSPEPLANLDEEFDVVLAGDVLEHLPRPDVLLRRCRSLLRPNGSLIVSVPNVAHVDLKLTLLRGEWEYREWGLLDRTHLRFFTRRSLDRLLRDAGYAPVELFRVVRPLGTTELELDTRRVNADVVNAALSDPDAETYQFVMRALVEPGQIDSGDHSELELAEQVDVERARRHTLEHELDNALSRLAEADDRRLDLERALAAVQATRTFRYTAAPRGLYSRVKRALARS